MRAAGLNRAESKFAMPSKQRWSSQYCLVVPPNRNSSIAKKLALCEAETVLKRRGPAFEKPATVGSWRPLNWARAPYKIGAPALAAGCVCDNIGPYFAYLQSSAWC